jgi:hypothetical protein
MEGEAKNWFRDYQDKVQQGLEVWEIASFIEALRERFVSDDYQTKAYNELQDLKYNNNIEDFVAIYKRLATKARLTGPALREPLISALPGVIQARLSLAETTNNDQEWYQQVLSAGRSQERYWKSQKKGKTIAKPKTTAGPSNTRTQDKKFASVEEAIKGIPKNVVDHRKNNKSCLRCGYHNHNCLYCRMREPNIKISALGSGISYQPPEDQQDENQQVANSIELDQNDYMQEAEEFLEDYVQQDIDEEEQDFY